MQVETAGSKTSNNSDKQKDSGKDKKKQTKKAGQPPELEPKGTTHKLWNTDDPADLSRLIRERKEQLRAEAIKKIAAMPKKHRRWFKLPPEAAKMIKDDDNEQIPEPPVLKLPHRPYIVSDGPLIQQTEEEEIDMRARTVLLYTRCSSHKLNAPSLYVLTEAQQCQIIDKFKRVVVESRAETARQEEEKKEKEKRGDKPAGNLNIPEPARH